MHRSEIVTQIFKAHDIQLEGPTVEDRQSGALLVFVSTISDNEGRQRPSNYLISKAENDARKKGISNINIIIVNDSNHDINSSVKSMLLRRYQDDVRNVFSSVQRGGLSVWVEPRSPISTENSEEIRNSIAGLVRHFGIELEVFVNTAAMNLPSERACISALRLHSPATEADIMLELERRGFEVPDEEWLKRLLDRQRKRKIIHRRKDGHFVMTLEGLRSMGSGKTRSSPDVRRALALARRHQ